MYPRIFCISIALLLCLTAVSQSKPIAHSHNDYEQIEPLTKALALGFTSIEIDITTHKGEIKVSHNQRGLEKKPTIQELYLEKLYSYVTENPEARLWLLVDLKKGGDNILDLLHDLIAQRGELFMDRNSAEKKPLQIILSGSVDREYIANYPKYKYFFLDGRVKHLDEQWDSQLMPLISANFNSVVSWNGNGEMPHSEKSKIEDILKKANEQGKKLRFWRTPDTPNVWDTLIELNLHVIGVDHLGEFSSYLQGLKQ